MRIALISDIHANALALEAVLHEIPKHATRTEADRLFNWPDGMTTAEYWRA